MRRLLFTLLCLFTLSCPAHADEKGADKPGEVSAAEVLVSTPKYPPNMSYEPSLGVYEYRVSWQGIGAANVKVYVEKVDGEYHVTATARTNRYVDVFYKLRYRASGVLAAGMKPVKMEIDQRENSKVKQDSVTFLPNGDIHSVRWKRGKLISDEVFDPQNVTLEPFSAGFLARSLPWELGQTRHFDTFSGQSRFLVSLTAEDRTEMKVNGELRPVWVIVPKVIKLTAGDGKSKLRKARIYVTADERKEILLIKSDVFIGSVNTQLVSFTPLADTTPGPQFAKLQDPNKVVITR
ncbi:MAG: DUF3108 domain-containing protein [Bdellovibrionales bacterium]|nr:DUF3108 domain-containing protein [Bdellovibrionales bacterium]